MQQTAKILILGLGWSLASVFLFASNAQADFLTADIKAEVEQIGFNFVQWRITLEGKVCQHKNQKDKPGDCQPVEKLKSDDYSVYTYIYIHKAEGRDPKQFEVHSDVIKGGVLYSSPMNLKPGSPFTLNVWLCIHDIICSEESISKVKTRPAGDLHLPEKIEVIGQESKPGNKTRVYLKITDHKNRALLVNSHYDYLAYTIEVDGRSIDVYSGNQIRDTGQLVFSLNLDAGKSYNATLNNVFVGAETADKIRWFSRNKGSKNFKIKTQFASPQNLDLISCNPGNQLYYRQESDSTLCAGLDRDDWVIKWTPISGSRVFYKVNTYKAHQQIDRIGQVEGAESAVIPIDRLCNGILSGAEYIGVKTANGDISMDSNLAFFYLGFGRELCKPVLPDDFSVDILELTDNSVKLEFSPVERASYYEINSTRNCGVFAFKGSNSIICSLSNLAAGTNTIKFKACNGEVTEGISGNQIEYCSREFEIEVNTKPENAPEQPEKTADLNRDGVTDLADFAVFRQEFGQTGVNLASDLNRDGRVDLTDFALFRQKF